MEWGWDGYATGTTMPPVVYWLTVASVVILTALGLVLNAMVLRKAGRHWLWAVLFLFPLAYVVGIWLFAFTRWPRAAATASVPPEGVAGEGGIGGRKGDEPPFIGPAPNARRDFTDRRRW